MVGDPDEHNHPDRGVEHTKSDSLHVRNEHVHALLRLDLVQIDLGSGLFGLRLLDTLSALVFLFFLLFLLFLYSWLIPYGLETLHFIGFLICLFEFRFCILWSVQNFGCRQKSPKPLDLRARCGQLGEDGLVLLGGHHLHRWCGLNHLNCSLAFAGLNQRSTTPRELLMPGPRVVHEKRVVRLVLPTRLREPGDRPACPLEDLRANLRYGAHEGPRKPDWHGAHQEAQKAQNPTLFLQRDVRSTTGAHSLTLCLEVLKLFLLEPTGQVTSGKRQICSGTGSSNRVLPDALTADGGRTAAEKRQNRLQTTPLGPPGLHDKEPGDRADQSTRTRR